jgi:hypothetical protein
MRAPGLQLPRGARQEILQRLLPRCGWYHGDRVQLPTCRMRSHGGRRGRSVRLLPFSRGTNRGLETCKKLRFCRSAVRPQAANPLLGGETPSCAVRLSAIRTTAPESRPPAPSCSTAAFSDSLGSRSPQSALAGPCPAGRCPQTKQAACQTWPGRVGPRLSSFFFVVVELRLAPAKRAAKRRSLSNWIDRVTFRIDCQPCPAHQVHLQYHVDAYFQVESVVR